MAEENQNGSRVEQMLEDLRNLLQSNRVYTNPPSGFRMDYPCIVVEEQPFDTDYANNHIYRADYQFRLTYISKSPFSEIPRKLLDFSMCSQDRVFTADNLRHYVFTIFL